MQPRILFVITVGLLGVVTGCKDRAADDGGSQLVQGARSLWPEKFVQDAGPRAIAFAVEGWELWAVDRAGLQDVLRAVHTNRGLELAKALERYPAVPPELIHHARAVRGREPVSEPAEAALVGPLSLPVGGVHQPVKTTVALPSALLPTAGPDCQDPLRRPGAVGQLLAGIGRTRAIFLLEDHELARFAACVQKVQLPDGTDPTTRAEHARLRQLLDAGSRKEVAVLLALGD